MKIQNELLTGIQAPQELKKPGATQKPEGDFASVLADTLSSSEGGASILPGIIGSGSLSNLSALAPTTQLSAFSPEEDKAMDEISDLLDLVEEYGSRLAGKDGLGQEDLKSAFKMLEGISASAGEIKKTLGGLGNNPELAGIVNQLEVMAATEKFKMNRGDYFA